MRTLSSSNSRLKQRSDTQSKIVKYHGKDKYAGRHGGRVRAGRTRSSSTTASPMPSCLFSFPWRLLCSFHGSLGGSWWCRQVGKKARAQRRIHALRLRLSLHQSGSSSRRRFDCLPFAAAAASLFGRSESRTRNQPTTSARSRGVRLAFFPSCRSSVVPARLQLRFASHCRRSHVGVLPQPGRRV